MIETINDILFWILASLLIWHVYILAFNKGVPNIRTATQTKNKIIEVLKEERARKGGASYKIVDLGSGNGRMTRDIARAIPDAEVLGIEISLKSYYWSCLMQRFFRIPNLSYIRKDVFDHDLSSMDAVVFYLIYFQMESLGQKLNKDLKPGTLVIANRFKLGDGWVPAKTVEAKTLFPFEKEFHVYYKGAA